MIRILDFIFALMGLVFGFPVLVVLMLIGFFDTGSPVFRQVRVGRNKKPFTLVKFRTMKLNTASVASHLASSSSITPYGHFLRRTKLDELPQLWNVLKGEMSLVGPRPLPFRDVARFESSWQQRRFSVKPGMTCLWQVNGRSRTPFEDWVKLDLDYIDQWSFGLDLRILVKTLPAVVRGTGAY